jgi:hypothetical protein
MLGRSEHGFALASLVAVLGLVASNCLLLFLDGSGPEPREA